MSKYTVNNRSHLTSDDEWMRGKNLIIKCIDGEIHISTPTLDYEGRIAKNYYSNKSSVMRFWVDGDIPAPGTWVEDLRDEDKIILIHE